MWNLARKLLLHDRLRFAVAIAGVSVSVMTVSVVSVSVVTVWPEAWPTTS